MNLIIINAYDMSKIGTVIECTGKETTDASAGLVTLELAIDPHTANFDKLQCEDVIAVDGAVFDWRADVETDTNLMMSFRVKMIDKTERESVSVTCYQNRVGWRAALWHHSFNYTGSTVSTIMADITSKVNSASGTSARWSYGPWGATESETTASYTIDKSSEDIDGLDAIDAVKEAAGYDAVCYIGDNGDYIDGHIASFLKYDKIEYKGQYIIDDLNLQKFEYTVDTTEIYNRLYMYGAQQSDGSYITLSDANNGKEYIDDTSYISDQIISHVEYDDSVNDSSVLLEKAKTLLSEHARPKESYELSIADLAKIDPAHYSLMDYKVGDKVMVIDKQRNTNIMKTIIKIERDLENPENTIITLADNTVSIVNYFTNGFTKLS